ncbi:MAG TPA: xanthine dehydrogenase small subunit [Aestuariivirgaceae bacterium]|nr:xanthine dehydrogenase small subunit [Aestuariivirgaceae bacterium]
MRRSIRFLRRGQPVELPDIEPTEMLLDHIRLREGACGTKEGCAEGDCGACTVALGRLVDGKLVYQPVNSCILMTGMADGADVVIVDDLAREGEPLHPVQQALVDYHGSQCGFCTPGFVMSLFTLYQSGKAPDRRTVTDWLAGNLCRCTGYRPIVDAALASCSGNPADSHARNAAATAAALGEIGDTEDLFVGSDERFFAAPASLRSLADLYAAHANATLVAGATDVGLWVTKQLRDLPKIIHVGRVADFDTIGNEPDALVIGAGATYAQAEAQLAAIDPDVAELLRRLGSKQVRALGTIGGNIANASPVGDSPPLLIALDATIELNRGGEIRTVPLDSFFIAYGKQDRQPGEFVQSVRIPKLAANQHLRCYKISKRFDQDISAVLAAFRLTVENGAVTAARVAFGGMAATPKRGLATEAALAGARLGDEPSWDNAIAALELDFAPISDLRASAEYRIETAQALLRKALRELSGSPGARVTGIREARHEPAA